MLGDFPNFATVIGTGRNVNRLTHLGAAGDDPPPNPLPLIMLAGSLSNEDGLASEPQQLNFYTREDHFYQLRERGRGTRFAEVKCPLDPMLERAVGRVVQQPSPNGRLWHCGSGSP